MAKTKHLEGEVWCPACKSYAGKIYRIEIKEGQYEHVTEPKKMPKYCSQCEGVLVRK